MAKEKRQRPVFHPRIGAELKELRERRKWSVEAAVLAAKRGKHHGLTSNKLRLLEEGKTHSPDQAALRAIAFIYKLDYEMLAWRFITANFGVSQDYEPAPLEAPLAPEVARVARLLEAMPSAVRTSLIGTLDTLGVALDIGRRTAESDESDSG